MNIYVESNFVLELVFQQEQFSSCEKILQLCQAGRAQLIIPAYSLAEPHEKLTRQARSRKELHRLLEAELRQLARTASYQTRINNIQNVLSLLVDSSEEEQQRFVEYRNRFLSSMEIIPLTSHIINLAATYELPYDLKPQDALVYVSVITHLQQHRPSVGCFLNRNFRDFDTPNIINELNTYNCRMISRFNDGYNFIQSQM